MKWLTMLCCCCLPLRHIQLTSGYGYRIHPVTGKYAFHYGVDLRARSDTVFSIISGNISEVGYNYRLGVFIRIADSDLEITYGHLSQVFVLTGDSVSSCFPVGITGATGRVTGEHLHFSVRYRGRTVNPLKFLLYSINNLK